MLSTDNDIAKIVDLKNMRDFASKQNLKSLFLKNLCISIMRAIVILGILKK